MNIKTIFLIGIVVVALFIPSTSAEFWCNMNPTLIVEGVEYEYSKICDAPDATANTINNLSVYRITTIAGLPVETPSEMERSEEGTTETEPVETPSDVTDSGGSSGRANFTQCPSDKEQTSSSRIPTENFTQEEVDNNTSESSSGGHGGNFQEKTTESESNDTSLKTYVLDFLKKLFS